MSRNVAQLFPGQRSTRRTTAFTLIELLIVVGIISILAAIATPNFLEAQIRAKASRAKADMRTVATAMETYHVDNNHYPDTYVLARWERFFCLTTPVAYMTTVPKDPFRDENRNEGDPLDWGPRYGCYKLGATPLIGPTRFAISSDGPDRDEDSVPIKAYPGFSKELMTGQVTDFESFMWYDATNGTVSSGDIFRCSDGSM